MGGGRRAASAVGAAGGGSGRRGDHSGGVSLSAAARPQASPACPRGTTSRCGLGGLLRCSSPEWDALLRDQGGLSQNHVSNRQVQPTLALGTKTEGREREVMFARGTQSPGERPPETKTVLLSLVPQTQSSRLVPSVPTSPRRKAHFPPLLCLFPGTASCFTPWPGVASRRQSS